MPWLALTGVAVLMFGPSPANNRYAAGETCAFPYIVSNGDWLSRIAARVLGDIRTYPLIVEATNAQKRADG